MIYGHLPEDARWQLLAHPLKMKQYLMLPQTHNAFFEFNLNIISPAYSPKVNLKTGELYGEDLIKVPNNEVNLSGSLHDRSNKKVEWGDCVYFDRDQNLWRCRFASQNKGKHTILIFAGIKDGLKSSTLDCAVKFIFDIDRLPSSTISYPLTWSHFFDYKLEIVKPANSHRVDWSSNNGHSCCEILVRSPDNVCLSASVEPKSTGKNVKDGLLVNYNAEKSLWRCLFTPSTTGVSYKLTLFAKQLKETQSHCVVQFDLPQAP